MIDKEDAKKDQIDPLITKVGSLFKPDSPMRALNQNIDRFATTIAALFIIQHQKFHWPWPNFIYGYQGYRRVSKAFSKWTNLPYITKAPKTKGSVTLFIGPEPFIGAIDETWHQTKIQQLSLI